MKKIIKWTAIFCILISYTYFAFFGSIPKLGIVSAATGYQFVPLYINSTSGIERLNSEQIENLIFNHQITFTRQELMVLDQNCNVKATGGTVFDNSKNELKFSTYLKNSEPGKGSLTMTNKEHRVSLKFDIIKILITNEQKLSLQVKSSGTIDREKIQDQIMNIDFDRINNLVNVTINGMVIENMDAKVLNGCGMSLMQVDLVNDLGTLPKSREISEVRDILKQNPNIIDNYQGLNKLYKTFWWLNLPPGIISG